MSEWLLRNEECPLCRNNYLSLDGGDVLPPIPASQQANQRSENGSNQPDQDDRYAYLRGMHVVHLLQALANTRPNATIRLEGVELSNGQRGNLEFQRANEGNTAGARGLNIRVSNLEGENAARSDSNTGQADGEIDDRGRVIHDGIASNSIPRRRSEGTTRWATLTSSGRLRLSTDNDLETSAIPPSSEPPSSDTNAHLSEESDVESPNT